MDFNCVPQDLILGSFRLHIPVDDERSFRQILYLFCLIVSTPCAVYYFHIHATNMTAACRVQVRIHSTDGIPKYSGFLDKTDQYVRVRLGEVTKQTQVIMNAGKSATFEEDMIFDYHGEDVIVLEVYDYDVMSAVVSSADDHIGSGVFPLKSPLMSSGHWTGEVNLRSQTGRPTGRIKASVEFLQRASGFGNNPDKFDNETSLKASNIMLTNVLGASGTDRTTYWGASQVLKEKPLEAEDFASMSTSADRSIIWSQPPSQTPEGVFVLTGSTLFPPQ